MKNNEAHSIFQFNIDPKYYPMHNYLTFCNDVLVSILRYADEKNLTKIELEFRNSSDSATFMNLAKNSDWQGWLLKNGYEEELYTVYYRHLFFSLIRDFCNYVLESINCAAKLKVAVSYALLRKPLKDTLGFIEWLYVDRKEVLDLLVQGNPSDMEITKDRAQRNTAVVEKKQSRKSFFEFRYDKKNESSLEHIWHNANHLITTRNNISKTEPGNLNFVFADKEVLEHYSEYYYRVIPSIMMYATELICTMFEDFASLNTYTTTMNMMIRTVRFLKVVSEKGEKVNSSLLTRINMPLICPFCGHGIRLNERRMEKVCSGKVRCCKCAKVLNTGRYVFDWENIEITLT